MESQILINPPVAVRSFREPQALPVERPGAAKEARPPSSTQRTVLYPYGRGVLPSFTLSLRRTSIPAPDGGTYLEYILYQHDRKGKDSRLLFEGHEAAPQGPIDMAATSLSLIELLCSSEPASERQIAFMNEHARMVAHAARARFGWVEKPLARLKGGAPAPLRLALPVLHKIRPSASAGPRHIIACGALAGVGETRFAARADFEAHALAALAAPPPIFRVGEVTGAVYAQYAQGLDHVVQLIDPRTPSKPLGDAARFRASSDKEAAEIAETLIAETERKARSRSARPGAFGGGAS